MSKENLLKAAEQAAVTNGIISEKETQKKQDKTDQTAQKAEVISRSFYEDSGLLYEQITGLKFAVYNPQDCTVNYVSSATVPEGNLVPISYEI